MTKEQVVIRLYRREDMDQASAIVVEAFRSKFLTMTGMEGDEAKSMLIDMGGVGTEENQGCWVAEVKGNVAGLMILKWQGQDKPTKAKSIGFVQLVKKFGLYKVVKLSIGLSLLNNRVQADECYIEMIAVANAYRGLGIGTMLMNKGKHIVEVDPRLRRYTLFVAALNTGAIKLYERLGFKIKSRHKSLITKVFFGERAWLYMVNDLKKTSQGTKMVMRANWYLGFLGLLVFMRSGDLLAYFSGSGSPLALLNLLWLLWLTYFIPHKR